MPDPVKLTLYTLVDAEFGYEWDKARLTAYATNLFDKEYLVRESGHGISAALGDRRDYRF